MSRLVITDEMMKEIYTPFIDAINAETLLHRGATLIRLLDAFDELDMDTAPIVFNKQISIEVHRHHLEKLILGD